MVRASVVVTLWDSDRKFRLPSDGTPSLLYRFLGATGEEAILGARAYSDDVDTFAPGTSCRAELRFWADIASDFVRAGERFEVHYPEQIGVGEVIEVLPNEVSART